MGQYRERRQRIMFLRFLLLLAILYSLSLGLDEPRNKSPRCRFSMYSGKNPTGIEELTTLDNVRNPFKCAKTCRKTEDCKAWRFDKTDKSCVLFSSYESFEEDVNFISGSIYCLNQ